MAFKLTHNPTTALSTTAARITQSTSKTSLTTLNSVFTILRGSVRRSPSVIPSSDSVSIINCNLVKIFKTAEVKIVQYGTPMSNQRPINTSLIWSICLIYLDKVSYQWLIRMIFILPNLYMKILILNMKILILNVKILTKKMQVLINHTIFTKMMDLYLHLHLQFHLH